MYDPVLLYTSPGCPDCAAVRRHLEEHHIAYEERDVTAPGVAEEAKSRYGVRVAPITVIAGEALWGTLTHQKPRLDELLARAQGDGCES
ncbi:glutaredoxin domain-containing protein [Acidithiobacillus thiooxidans]|uniref:glutaredoxin family protein n=1 Tax=Acidithiobacillus thiooxidans TaxID=930 RepID=UPI00285B62DE|nr:glutaredoxin domain-containing protein [Acidithiobacillus thiooxidans]MDR7925961.1 glutaredoxin domain-containing protein [Acidithiobacillus thiooxidans]